MLYLFILINVKMPTIIGILSFMSMINFLLDLVEHKESFKTLDHIIWLPMKPADQDLQFSIQMMNPYSDDIAPLD